MFCDKFEEVIPKTLNCFYAGELSGAEYQRVKAGRS
jgi:hypothetical protein